MGRRKKGNRLWKSVLNVKLPLCYIHRPTLGHNVRPIDQNSDEFSYFIYFSILRHAIRSKSLSISY